MGLMRVAAATEGRPAVDALDLWLAPYVAADTPAQVPALAAWVDAEIAQALPQDAAWLTRAVEAFERQAQIEESATDEPGPDADTDAGKLSLARGIAGDDAGGAAGPLRIVADALAQQRRRRYSPVHLAARLAQLDELAGTAGAHRAAIAAQREGLDRALQGRLWLPPALAARWLAGHAHTLAVLDGLLERLAATRAAFAALPQDETVRAAAPEPVHWEPA
jgi:MoxR-like ATPase